MMQAKTKDYADTLAEDGVVKVDDYFDEETCDELYTKISSEIEGGDIETVEGGKHCYSELANWGTAVANKRKGRDDGMIDVFNVDNRVPEVKSFKEDEMINDIINSAASESYSPDNVNVYWNRSVTTTRDFHADTYRDQFKSFVYLTDVPDRSYGPFSYIKGTQDISGLKIYISKKINSIKGNPSTDAVFYDEDDVTYFTAPKGTLIISNQAGYHRGDPQEEGRERMLVTTSYTPSN